MSDEPRPVNNYTALAPSVRQAPAKVWTSEKQALCAMQIQELCTLTGHQRGHVPEKSKSLIWGILSKKWMVPDNPSTVNATLNKGDYIPVYASRVHEGVEVHLPLFLTSAPD